jgi:hypothetical protein
VLDRDRRHVQADELAGLARVVAGGEHQVLGDDVALGRMHPPFPGGRAFDRLRLGMFVNLSAGAARALAQRHGEISRGDVSVVRVVKRADDGGGIGAAAQFDQRPQLLHALGTDDLEGHTDGVGRAAVLLVLVHALFAGRQAQVAAHVETDVLSGLLRQALVEIDRVFMQLADRVTHIEERQQAGGVPRGPGRELGALDQGDIGPALLRQVIERAHPNHAAADNQDPNMRLHESILRRKAGRQ